MKQYAVIGLGRFGSSVAKTLAERGQQVLAIDINQDVVQQAAEYSTNAVCIDATDPKTLKKVGAHAVDVAIVAIGKSLEASVLITLALKEIGVLSIIAKAVTENHGKVLGRIGVTSVVFPERDMGAKLANKLISPEVVEEINLSEEYSMFEIPTPREFAGKSLKELAVRAKHGMNIIAIKKRPQAGVRKPDEGLNIMPTAGDILEEGDVMLILAPYKVIDKLKKDKVINTK